MKMLTEAEHSELIAAKAERDEYVQAVGIAPLTILMRTILDEVDRRGLILTVEQKPLLPLAMGNYRTVWSVREKRGAA